MLELKILQFGLMLHLAIQLLSGLKTNQSKTSKKILWFTMFIFTLTGVILTIINLNSTEDFGESGTKRFNPFIMLIIWGNLLNLAVYLVSHVSLRLGNKIMSKTKNKTSM